MTDQTRNLAAALAGNDPVAEMRIGVITAIDTGAARKVRTDQTDLAWIARDQDARLAVGDRVWMIRQSASWVVGGRLSGPQSAPYVKRKTLPQTVTNSATVVNDTEIVIDVLPGWYRLHLFAHFSAPSAASDFKSRWNATNGATVLSTSRSCLGPGIFTAAVDGSLTSSVMRSSGHGFATEIYYGTDNALDASHLEEDLLVQVLTAGQIQWMWAQNTATSGVTTTVSAATRCYVTPTVVL